ncbi:hypothetical protein SLS63_011437 [Diaporthe eres]|uniref:Uncharacterized protein n=1 Tax=Diaporthe eres TaxID=83184 RepID=A0ABR1NU54_DIAER
MNIHEFKLDETASFNWVHVEDLAGVYVLLVRAILEREDHGEKLDELAEEIMGGLVDMAEQSWAGHKVMKGTVAKKLLGWNPTRLEEAWKQDYWDVLNALEKGISGNSLETSIGK